MVNAQDLPVRIVAASGLIRLYKKTQQLNFGAVASMSLKYSHVKLHHLSNFD